MAERMTERHLCSTCAGMGYTLEKGEDCRVCNRRVILKNHPAKLFVRRATGRAT